MIPLPPRPTWEAVAVFLVVFVAACMLCALLSLAAVGVHHLMVR